MLSLTHPQAVTSFINKNIEEIMASRVLQSGSMLSMNDVKQVGKERLKEINRQARTKKKSKIEEKVEKLEQMDTD